MRGHKTPSAQAMRQLGCASTLSLQPIDQFFADEIEKNGRILKHCGILAALPKRCTSP